MPSFWNHVARTLESNQPLCNTNIACFLEPSPSSIEWVATLVRLGAAVNWRITDSDKDSEMVHEILSAGIITSMLDSVMGFGGDGVSANYILRESDTHDLNALELQVDKDGVSLESIRLIQQFEVLSKISWSLSEMPSNTPSHWCSDVLVSPEILEAALPMTENSKKTAMHGRKEISRALNGQSDKLVVIVGPCSIHDCDSALEYAKRLKKASTKYQDSLILIMRTYLEKPRTTVGWKGLVNDPYLNGSFNINQGLFTARKLLGDITDLGVPVAVELLDTLSPCYFNEYLSWGAIGARTTESQLHRELASGVPFPVGFKNGTTGTLSIAIDAIQTASHAHTFLGTNKSGSASVVRTKGNESCHVILRGGSAGPNYEQPFVTAAAKALKERDEIPRLMIDASHGNSRKNYRNQVVVVQNVAQQIREAKAGGGEQQQPIFGVMIESHLREGSQKIATGGNGCKALEYGVSVTDACVGWETTLEMLDVLAQAVLCRRLEKGAKV
ncbi:hypothetical protein CcCBS67573_g04638 [Chytriomyces confervae]|uniref:3-deoxy-7-phosphoheptulonate synthase n=1 Tax=Chytriomyces confervae TaxID=246404 RepID=A0A507FCZ0_9FUNG|nr:hypothetical protein CcCBS67573_g04638 [Chytriomyces confervae]